MAKATPIKKPKLIIAGPGAGKTHNMVDAIIKALEDLHPNRYIAVITYTNSATNNIKLRLAKRIALPENLFIGTMHSFINKFIVIPFSSLVLDKIGKDKIFMQCDTDDIFDLVSKQKKKEQQEKGTVKKQTDKDSANKEAAQLKVKIRGRLNEKGMITFDQTIALARRCMEVEYIKRIISNRFQFLFIDEFQDTSNGIAEIIEHIRKQGKTTIQCVGDPEQYIQSFDSAGKIFGNIPILKLSANSKYEVEFNKANRRCSIPIITFLNKFNGREFNGNKFEQKLDQSFDGPPVLFIDKPEHVKDMLPLFYAECDKIGIHSRDRYVIGKKKEVIKRISAALNNQYISPEKNSRQSLLGVMKNTLLSALQLNQAQFCNQQKCDVFHLRKICIAIIKAIRDGEITNQDTFGKFIFEKFDLKTNAALPIMIENFQVMVSEAENKEYVTVSTIHTIKGLEADAVLAIARTEAELLLWLETDHSVRDAYRDNEMTDYPRLGYVAFSRAKKILAIACLQKISPNTKSKIEAFGVHII
jgi:DNA helicase-2/ATP-dependent DNA helicase PcrA